MAERFPIRFTGANKAIVVLGITAKNSFVELVGDRVHVQFGYAFRADIERTGIASCVLDPSPVWAGAFTAGAVDGSSTDRRRE